MIPAALLLALVGAWELYADFGPVDPLILPAPHDVAASLVDDRAALWANLSATATEVGVGLLLGLAGGAAIATLIHFSRPLRRALYPLLVASQTIPPVLAAPLLVAWFGFDVRPKVAIVGLVCFFPVVVAAMDALRRVDPALIKLMRTLDASRRQTFWRVEAPSALPALLSGAKIAAAVATIAAVFAEQAGADQGLGYLMLTANGELEAPEAYAALVLLCLLAVSLFGAIRLLERRLVPWAESARPGTGS